MLNFSGKYKIVTNEDKCGFIAANHKDKELSVSKDIKLERTDDGNLRAIFPNPEKKSGTDCSLIISDPSSFNYCVQKDGKYALSASNVTFDGTNNNDTLILDGNSSNNTIYTGKGNDTIKIVGVPQKGILNRFQNNKIYTGDGNDNINIFGNFDKFRNNEIYLGKGSDKFSALINPNNDVQSREDFISKQDEYRNTVSKNEIYAINGYTECGDKKGWFEKNSIETKTYSANQLFGGQLSDYIHSGDNMTDGFQEYKYKPEPKKPTVVSSEPQKAATNSTQTENSKPKLTKRDFENRIAIGSMGYMLFNDIKMQEAAFKAMEDYVKFMSQ